MKYHVNPATGNPNKCTATKRPCPHGGSDAHFEASTIHEARTKAFQMVSDSHHDFPDSLKKARSSSGSDETSGGNMLNTSNVMKGNEYEDKDGRVYRVTSFTPAGEMGIRESAGPRIGLTLVKDDGSLSDYTVNVQHGAHRTPDQFVSVKRAMNGFSEGVCTYDRAAIATVTKKEFLENPHEFIKSGRSNMVSVIAPYGERLSEKKKVEIAAELWKLSGRDPAVWDEVDDEMKLGWAQRYVGTDTDVKVTVEDGHVSWATRSSGGNYHDLKDTKLV